MRKILFVCLGNICRSSMGEGILRAKTSGQNIANMTIDSAGTSNWHIGKGPDSRAIATMAAKNIDISTQKSRQVNQSDFEEFDLIIAMDTTNLDDLRALAPGKHHPKIKKCLDYSSISHGGDVPDPYYGGDGGFDHVMMLLDDACDGIINQNL